MREVVLDTETTGLGAKSGHRIVEIGCIELIDRAPSGRIFHSYLNPERDVPDGARQVHGLTRKFLSKHPFFSGVANKLLTFLGDAALIMHNARFDLNFLNAEFSRAGYPPLPQDRAIDTMLLFRCKYPGHPSSLDAVCERYNVDVTDRVTHGALRDAKLLVKVYLKLLADPTAPPSPGPGDPQYFFIKMAEIRLLKREGKFEEAEALLNQLLGVAEAESKKNRFGVFPFPYEQLAIIFRKKKDYEREIAILRRYEQQAHIDGPYSQMLTKRLRRSIELLARLQEKDRC
ncbi:MAG: DNA polymerase III subunit epsilon [Candidatus Tectomicrobia bacterium]|uniref:DNA polymerase III subunit epsilon n=1 Tax=Tectimicrobiota bacterium TaxID=2528274 RepID=A0A932MM60_UNCTE|nr:DNA polymerase III subunit epsilon [Candidatus Tectomicrobia bacterium]